ncbi:MAG: hypothetical protein KatS3mg066_3969 [Fischerella sp.]|nr:MAG: hypothetical protein KatS3mg066_3969 [Fischerella sp.]
MSLTPQQQRAAYANGNVAVIAGAGTGKTHMLAERYLYHLQKSEFSPLEIVAVTFTDKAAAELRSRIRLLVSQKLPERSDLLAELEAAQISTIHALAMRICREHPQAADVPPDFTVLDELEGVLWVNQWLDEALDTLPVELYEKVPYSLMSQTLQVLLQDPIAAEKALAQGAEKWQELAQELQQKALRELLQHPTWQQARTTLQNYAGQASDRLEVETRQPALQAMEAVDLKENITESLTVIAGLKINIGSKKNWTDGGLEIVKETIKGLRNLVEKALKDGLVTLEFSVVDEELKAILPALQEAFSSVQKYINQEKRRSRVLDFADLEVGALRALQDEQVQFYYAQRWRAFLVDEFQDTNPVQSEILQRLTQNTLLTIVGDAKQSIYGFRRADVEVFRSWCDRITNSGGNEEVLTTSFRTHKLLIDHINSIFTPLLGDLHQDLDAYRADCPNSYPPVQVYTVEAESDINKPQRLRVEAFHLAKLLVALKLEDEQGETQKPVLYTCLEHLRKQREEAETLRVLYVALTRARDQLILTATDESGGSLSGLATGLAAAGISINTIPFNPELAQAPVPPEPPLPSEPHSLLINSVGSGLFELPVTALSEYAQCPKKFAYRFIQGHPGIGSGVGTARRVGTLAHLALERGIRDIETLAGFDVSLPKESVSEALQLAQRFEEVADFAQFQQGQWELPVNLKVGSLTFNGIVDLLGDDWVLDFKTDQEIAPERHRFQLWAYAQATGCTNAHIAYLRHDYLHTFSTEELQTTGQEAKILVQNILDGHFLANPSHTNCGFCVYQEICDERYQPTGEAAEKKHQIGATGYKK